MIAFLLILIPLIFGFSSFAIKSDGAAKVWAVTASVAGLVLAIVAACAKTDASLLTVNYTWLPVLGSRFALSMDGMSKMLVLLTALSMCLIFLSTFKNNYKNARSFYALMMLTQAGMTGVFLAADLLLFYFFWELALIPAYFLCSMWGGERRIAVTFKFFVYTFLGSLLMLVGVLYLNYLSPAHSFALKDIYDLKLSAPQQSFAFILFFIAFAIKMPLFPFHTWQPDTYEVSDTAITMMLSGVMVKMGLFAVIRWLVPVFPDAVNQFGHIIVVLSVISLLYASFIALQQDDLKRLIAYSSIAHIGLMSAAIFVRNEVGLQGVMVQMFNHGITVIGLWMVADAVERTTGTRKFSELGGLAQRSPSLTALLVVLAFANISLPLTNSFIGEFLMFNGLFHYNIWVTAIALLSIILAAAYTLRMVQKVFYGTASVASQNAAAVSKPMIAALAVVCILVIVLGVYPKPLIELTQQVTGALAAKTIF